MREKSSVRVESRKFESRKLKVYKVEKQLSFSGKKRSCEKGKTRVRVGELESVREKR
jgi:hypothetical protein